MLNPKEAAQILVRESESEFLRKTEFATMSFCLEKLLAHPKYAVGLLYKGEPLTEEVPLSGGESDNSYWVLDFPSDNFVTQMQLDDEWKQFILATSEKWLTFDLTRNERECVTGLISYLKVN